MPSPKLVTSLSFDRISPPTFVFEVVGRSEFSTIQLPGGRQPPPAANQHLRLLLRLKWILQALSNASSRRSTRTPLQTPRDFNKDFVLRVLAYSCDISGSARPDIDKPVDYLVLRRITLQLLTCTVALLVQLEPSCTAEEIDWVRTQIQDMVQGWSRHVPLSLVEASIIKELLSLVLDGSAQVPSNLAGSTDDSSYPIPSQLSISVAYDVLLGLAPVSLSEQSRSFWRIHDWLTSVCAKPPDIHQSTHTLAVYREALSKVRARPDHHFAFPLATYMFEELALHGSSAYKLLPHEEVVPDNQILNNILETSKSEATVFHESFPEHVSLVEYDQEAFSSPPTPRSPNLSPPPQSPTIASPNRSRNQSPISSAVMPRRKSPPTISNALVTPSIQPSSQDPPLQVPPSASTVEIRAYHYAPPPVEMPTRKPTHRPHLNSIPSIQIDGGLEVVEEANFDSSSDFEKMMQKPQLGLRPLSFHQGADARSISGISSIGSVSSRSKTRLFGRFGGSKKPTTSTLPASLEFCFSNCAEQAIFWCKKNPDSLIRLRHPFQHGERFEMLVPEALAPSPNKPQSRSIRLLAAAMNVVIALVHIEETRWLYILRNNAFQPLIAVPDTTPAILSICLSHDGALIALGCRHFILLYRIQNGLVLGTERVTPLTNLGDRVIRLQRMSFSTDSHRFISAVQVEHSTHKHAVFVSIWGCRGPSFRLEAQLDPIFLTVGYSDDTGITSIFLAGQSDSLAVPQAFLTAALSKSYPAILPIAPGMRNQHLDISDKRIDGAAQCASPATPYLCAIRSGRNKIFVVNVRTGTMEKLADFSAERKGAHLRHEHVALGMQGQDRVFALWRSGDEGLVLKSMARGADGRWGVKTVDVGPVYRLAAGIP